MNQEKPYKKINPYYYWRLPYDIDNRQVKEFAAQTGVSVQVAAIVLRRNQGDFDVAKGILGPPGDLPPFLEFPGMKEACKKIAECIEQGINTVIYSDFDADGVTSAVLLEEGLRFAGMNSVDVCIPSRFGDGYGLHTKNVSQLVSQGTGLIITTDCGITAVDACGEALRLGCQVIITDHHKPGDRIPDCVAVLDPCLSSWEHYRLDYLSGAGMAYLLSRALFRYMGIDEDIPGDWAYDLLTLSIAGDSQPLTGLNRQWVELGLQSIASTKRPGLKALSEVAGIGKRSGPKLTFERDVTFGLVPRINAAGRMQHASIAYKLLKEKVPQAATDMALELDKFNVERREIEDKIWKETMESLSPDMETDASLLAQYALCASQPDWHEGVLGIAASRIREKYNRPAAMVGGSGELLKGSVRGIDGFDVHSALSSCEEYLTRYGGHQGAGGFSIEHEKVEEFFRRFNAVSQEMLEDVSLLPCLDIDDVVDIENVHEDYCRDLLSMEPFGRDNPVPLVLSYGCTIQKVRAIGREKRHLELFLSGGLNSTAKRFIWFGQGRRAKEISWWKECDVVFYPNRNYFRGEEGVSLVVKDLRPSASPCKEIMCEIKKNMVSQGPLVVYTWVSHLAWSIVFSLQKQGIPSAFHSEELKGARLNDVKICLDTPGGVILSSAPWLLKDCISPACTGLNALLLHPPYTRQDWQWLHAFLKQNNVSYSIIERWVELGKYWLDLTWPDKEYMEKTWKLMKKISRDDKFVPYEYMGKATGYKCCHGSQCRESVGVATEAAVSIMIELGMLAYRENARLTECLLHVPGQPVDLNKSPHFSRGKEIKEEFRLITKGLNEEGFPCPIRSRD